MAMLEVSGYSSQSAISTLPDKVVGVGTRTCQLLSANHASTAILGKYGRMPLDIETALKRPTHSLIRLSQEHLAIEESQLEHPR